MCIRDRYRIYNDSDLNWIYLVKNLRNAGVSIESLIEFCRLAQLPKNENIQAQQKQILNKQLEELNENLKTIHDARDLLQYKIDNYDNHIAKINASDNYDDNVERLWERK
ncbi:MerR family transcriptional regulator [Staphylococcus aureus]|uniref:MerR family transcriptional regulator n=1 Tax=Staphylococcus aureus TaxID=1280 RepID=UPI000978786E|nr:MerR family transcriptional regulator [Staphylococcus aureus]ONH12511.1 MerR family transcriptional regulator [Staphylococcus aureus]